MGKENKGGQHNKKTGVLLACFLVLSLALCAFIGFYYYDLGHKLKIISYKSIDSYEELVAISEKPDGKYRLTDDIDMQGKEWVPFTFTGILEGNGHQIMNLNVTSVGSAVRSTYDGNMKCYDTELAGLFDAMEGATVNDLTLTNVYVNIESDSPCFAGTLAGFMENTVVSNCKVTGEVDLRAHDRMFGVGGVVGYGFGSFENVESEITLVCIDTDRQTKDEQFMGGIIGAGYPDILNSTTTIDGYASEHGYAHNGGMVGLYMIYPDDVDYRGRMIGNRIYGKITFFEENDDRRAYCKPLIGELLEDFETFEDNAASFQGIEVCYYDVDLLPGERSETYTLHAEETGRVNLEMDYVNEYSDATYGLFVNGRFVEKVHFPKGEGIVNEAVFMESGDNEVTLRYLPGDGNITFNSVTLGSEALPVKLFVVPHQDDEVLAFAGIIQNEIASGTNVKVLFLTNGDYYGTDYTAVRFAESISALTMLGVDKSDITILGYGDLTLEALANCEDQEQCFQSHSGCTVTYGVPSLNLYDYHFLNEGVEADYTGRNLRNDLLNYMYAIRPEFVFTTSQFEWHTDHQYTYNLTLEALQAIHQENFSYMPVFATSVIHGEDTSWPEKLVYDDKGTPVYEEFTDPFPSGTVGMPFNSAHSYTLTEEQIETKMKAIGEYKSQNEGCEEYPGTKEYNYSFCKSNEFYWTIDIG